MLLNEMGLAPSLFFYLLSQVQRLNTKYYDDDH